MHAQIYCAVYKDWLNPEKVFTTSKLFAEMYPMEKGFKKKCFLVVDPAISVLNKHLTFPTEDVFSFWRIL